MDQNSTILFKLKELQDSLNKLYYAIESLEKKIELTKKPSNDILSENVIPFKKKEDK